MNTNRAALRPTTCPVLIGRASYLETLLHLIEQACDGEGQTVLIAGEAGIGKSRLVDEVMTYVRLSHLAKTSSAATPPLIVTGHCYEPDRSLPYAPIFDILRSFFNSTVPQDIGPLLKPIAPFLVHQLPELVSLLATELPDADSGIELEQRRLFPSLAAIFTHLSQSQPLLLVIEDVHWSDETSLEFLLYLARRLSSHRILLLLTYRSEEVDEVFTPFLTVLDRERLTTELILPALTNEQVEQMIHTIFQLPRSAHSDLFTPIYRLTEGNPFFIEEVLKSLVTTGEIVYSGGKWERKLRQNEPVQTASLAARLPLPRSVQRAVQQRLDHLSPEARDLLSLAAVTGRHFDFTLLQHMTGRGETELVQLIKELVQAQLVVEEAEDVFAFRHALTRQAVYTDLLSRERRTLHHLVAKTLEQLYAKSLDVHLDDLSYHFYAAKSWPQVLEYAPRAAEKAQLLYASHTVVEQYTRAIEAAQHLSKAPAPQWYRARGQSYELLGNFAAARDDYLRTLEAFRFLQDRKGEWQSLFDLGYLWTGRDYEQAGGYLHQALSLARTMNDASLLARTLNRVGNWHMNLEEPLEGRQYHLEALSIFSAGSDQRGLAETLDFLGVASLMSGELIDSARYYEQAIALWRILDDRQGLISSLVYYTGRGGVYFTSTLVPVEMHGATSIRDAEEALMLARRLGSRADEAFALIFLGLCLGPRGEYGQALQNGEMGLRIATEIEHAPWMATGHLLLGILFLELLALPAARQHLEQALSLAKESGSLFLQRCATAFLASACIAGEDYAQAQEMLGNVFSPEVSPKTMRTIAARLVWSIRAECELAQRHADTALAILDQLISTTTGVAFDAVIPRLAYMRGEALIALNRWEEAEGVLLSAREAAQRQQAQPLLWRIEITLGRLLLRGAHRKRAEEAFTRARTVIEELASTIEDEELRKSFLHHALVQLPSHIRSSSRPADRQTFGGLTEREHEVALLIAQGHSSRAIAEKLIVSERTIEKHVERIMFKLDFSSRVQIAAWVVEMGLLNRSLS